MSDQPDIQVFVSGTWREDRAAAYADAARLVGTLIAQAGHSLACGPGTGVARHVIDGFRGVAPRAGIVRYYLPRRPLMAEVGEEIQPGWDELIDTDYDYPTRNVFQVSRSAGLIAISGGDGTLEEILPALIDYHLPVGVLRGSGQAATGLELLLTVFEDWHDNVLVDEDPGKLAQFVLDRIASGQAT